MTASTKRQLAVLGVMVVVYGLLAALTYLLFPLEDMVPAGVLPAPELVIPAWQLALANAAIVLVVYGLLGVAGLYVARRLSLPGVFRAGAGWRAWMLQPLLWGTLLGVAIVLAQWLFGLLEAKLALPVPALPQPAFPFSLVASLAAAIGEEILYRSFVLGLWALLLQFLLRRWLALRAVLCIANLLAAIAFAAGHLASATLVLGATSPAGIPPLLLAEIMLLNSAVGLAAGLLYVRQGLVAAIGLHFWVDVVLHVLSPLVLR